MPSIFLSYRRDDSAGYAGRLRSSLETRLGAGSVFRDVDAIEPGQDFVDAIETRVQACRVFLALIGQEWIDARNAKGSRRLDDAEDYVRREVATALGRPDLRVIPVLVEGAAVPGAGQLPPELMGLSRRHAVSLRDETWETDVDRLTDAIRKSMGEAGRKRDAATTIARVHRIRPLMWAGAGGLVVMALVALPRMFENDDPSRIESEDEASAATAPTGSASGPQRSTLPSEGVALAIPRISEIELNEQIYSLVGASLTPRGDSMTLRLRFRTFNESRYDHALFEALARLSVDNTVVTPLTSFDGILPGRTVLPADVTFVLPDGTATAVLQLSHGDESGELMLDLAPGGPLVASDGAAENESRSVGYPMYFNDEPVLLEADDVRIVLQRITVRQFVNKQRVAVTARMFNEGRYSEAFGIQSFRLALEDGTVLAPAIGESSVVEGSSTRIEQVVFEVPVNTTRIVVRTLRGDLERDFPVALSGNADPG